ncbi:hypothetical protein PV761_03350 [Arthrobacter sp. CC3]|uniref:hypothetical protein n=1 Tax=Arthrobacter sp. CC3 TaxID=3029185 RepID=UPI003265ADB1
MIELPWATPPVKPNGGYGSRFSHAAKVREARQTMGLLARAAKIPRLGKCQVLLVWHVGDRIARDQDNLAWTLKPLCDALASAKKPTDYRIVPDDTPEFMVKPMPVISYVKGQRKRLTVTITDIPAPEPETAMF